MYSISILGATGFIGKNLLQYMPYARGVSLRDHHWRKNGSGEVWINLVGKAHDHKGTAKEQDFYFANLELTQQIFQEFLKSEAKLLIHISSIAAVEEFESTKALTESDENRPFSIYGKSKWAAEKWLLEQELPEGKKLIILRPPMVHGQGDKGSLGLLYGLISKGIPYPLTSFDNQRSFISIDNFCFFITEIVEQYKKLESGIYHISDDEVVSTKQIIEIIERVENKKTPKLSLPKFLVIAMAKFGDIVPIPLNTKRLKKMTGSLTVSNQKLKTALAIEKLPLTAQEGLEKTIRSFKK